MNLSLTDWIFLQEGCLYVQPFLARCYLFRINDRKASLLVYHLPNVFAGGQVDADSMNFTAVVREVDAVYVHFAPSNTIPLDDLVATPPSRLDLSKDLSIRQPFGDLSLDMQTWQLPGNGMFDICSPNGVSHKFQIEGTEFQVQSPVPIVGLGRKLPKTDAYLRSWKISIANTADNVTYNVNCIKDWNLTAMKVKNDWQPTLALQLARPSARENSSQNS